MIPGTLASINPAIMLWSRPAAFGLASRSDEHYVITQVKRTEMCIVLATLDEEHLILLSSCQFGWVATQALNHLP